MMIKGEASDADNARNQSLSRTELTICYSAYTGVRRTTSLVVAVVQSRLTDHAMR